MKFIQFMTLTLAAVLLFTISAVAQPGQGQRQGQGRGPMSTEQRKAQIEKLATDLALNDAQKESYFKMEEDYAKKMQEFRSGNQDDPTAMREGMMKLRQERNESLQALLNEDQQIKYKAMMAERQDRGGQRGPQQAQEAQKEKEKGSKGKAKKKKKKGDGEG